MNQSYIHDQIPPRLYGRGLYVAMVMEPVLAIQNGSTPAQAYSNGLKAKISAR